MADSDSSSAVEDSPPQITSDELRQTIKEEMREKSDGKVSGKVYKTCFWKGLVSTDPEPEYDENGELIEPPEEKTVSNFSMIKRMMRLKAKQDAVPES